MNGSAMIVRAHSNEYLSRFTDNRWREYFLREHESNSLSAFVNDQRLLLLMYQPPSVSVSEAFSDKVVTFDEKGEQKERERDIKRETKVGKGRNARRIR